jgi:hypothetical protein
MLWAKLQTAPFGYYNTMAAGCLIGVTLRSCINGSFNWLDSNNNTHLPTAENLASMVNKMLDDKTLNNFLASGSAIWQQFKPYIQKLFALAPQEVVSEAEARKYAKQKIIGIGVPFWALQYLPSDKFGGDDAKTTVIKLTDLFDSFIYETSADQESVMADVLSLFNGRGVLCTAMMNALNDKSAMLSAFKQFIFSQATELDTLTSTLALTDKDLFDALGVYLQDAISAWRKDQVIEKLGELTQELSVISVLKAETGADVKTYRGIQTMLNNVFEYMKIPGTVVETLQTSWISALKLMRRISKTPWSDISDKDTVAANLQGNAKTVWENLTQPKLLLDAVLNTRHISYTDDELNGIYTELKQQTYETPVSAFDVTFDKLLENISYNRNAASLKTLWKSKSGIETVSDWCNNANIPVTWLFDDSDVTAIRTVKSIQDGKLVDKNALQNALMFLQNNDLASIKDDKKIDDSFFAHIGEVYRDAFTTDRTVLLDRLKTNAQLTVDVYSWESKIPEIHSVLNSYLQQKYQEQAKNRVRSMPDNELRDTVLRLLDKSPELYSNFLN